MNYVYCGNPMVENCAKEYLLPSIAVKPNTVGVNANNPAFLFYKSGVITTSSLCTLSKTTHVVVIVGYESTGDTPYWLVKNSFGTKWGEDGYVKIEITNEWPGVCGIYYGSWGYPQTEAW